MGPQSKKRLRFNNYKRHAKKVTFPLIVFKATIIVK